MDGYQIAQSFMLYNNIFTILFIVVSLAISALAFKVYRLTKERRTGQFSLAFLLIGLGHLCALGHFLMRFGSATRPFRGGLFAWPHIFQLGFGILYLAGAIVLFSMTIKTWRPQVPAALGAFALAGLVIASRANVAVHIFSTILFAFIAAYFLKNYLKHRELATLAVLFGFLCLLFGNLILAFSFRDMLFFTIGRSVQMAGYLAFLTNLVLVLKK